MTRFKQVLLSIPLLIFMIMLSGCEQFLHNTKCILLPRFQRSDIFGFVAGLGTTFAVLPDLVAMLRRRSTAGMNPRMAAIIGVFQILWIYYGILINFFSVGAYAYFRGKEKSRAAAQV